VLAFRASRLFVRNRVVVLGQLRTAASISRDFFVIIGENCGNFPVPGLFMQVNAFADITRLVQHDLHVDPLGHFV